MAVALSRVSASLRERPILLRALVVLTAVVAAYNYSLITLLRGLSLDSPLAYLGLVPFISLALIIVGGAAHRGEPDIHDRYLDYIIGIPLILAALVMIVVLPVPLSTFFWLWRLDLLSLPLFAAGALAIVFGARTLWRVKAAVMFLGLAWPIPYLFSINNWLDGFTSITIAALSVIAKALRVAEPVSATDGTFAVNHGGTSFLVSVSSACSGANGLVGFILIGIAFTLMVHGRLLPKLAWLAAGMALTWSLNLVRILLILAAGQRFGEGVAIGGLHPYIGLVTFNLGILAMLLSLRFFGLRIELPSRWLTPSSRDKSVQPAPRRKPAVQQVRIAFALVLGAAILAAPADFAMQRFELLANDLGPPRLTQLDYKNAPVSGWNGQLAAQYDWVTRYFGQNASWNRYVYASSSAPNANNPSGVPVVMDVVSTSDLQTFSTFGLMACYRFHNYSILEERRVDLGSGVTGHALSYWIPDSHSTWSAVYWEWPVNNGRNQKYERVVLNRVDIGGDAPVPPTTQPDLATRIGLAITTAIGGPQDRQRDANSVRRLDFMVSFGREVVGSAASHASQATAPSR